MNYYLSATVLFAIVSASVVFAADKVVVIPMGSSSDIQIVRTQTADYHTSSWASAAATCPSGYKVVGGSVACGTDSNILGAEKRAVNTSCKVWNQEAWGASCIDLSNPIRTYPPSVVEAICIRP